MATTSTLYASELLGKGQNAEFFGGFDKEWWLYQIRDRRLHLKYVNNDYTITPDARLPSIFIATNEAMTITLPDATNPDLGSGWVCYIKNGSNDYINIVSNSLLDGKQGPLKLKSRNTVMVVCGEVNGWFLMDTTARYVKG